LIVNTIFASVNVNTKTDILRNLIFAFLLMFPVTLYAQRDKVKHDPTHDDKWLHFGFSLGVNTMDFNIIASPMAVDSGIYSEVSTLRPGFHVHALSNLRLSDNFDLRFTPGIAFGGQREVNFVTRPGNFIIDPEDVPVTIESNFLEFPVLLKYKSQRLNNFRPFLVGGLNTRIDLATAKKTWGRSAKENNLLLLNSFDIYYEIGTGMDFYLPFFKFAIELKYSVGLNEMLRTSLKNGTIPGTDEAIFTNSIDKLKSRMFMVTFHFE